MIEPPSHSGSRATSAMYVALGAAAGVASIVFLNVQVSLANIDPADPDTWPNMALQIRYLFAPLLLGAVLLFAVLADSIVRLIVGASALRPAQYVALGLCYSLVLASLPMAGILPRHPSSLLIGPALAMLTAGFLRWRYSR